MGYPISNICHGGSETTWPASRNEVRISKKTVRNIVLKAMLSDKTAQSHDTSKRLSLKFVPCRKMTPVPDLVLFSRCEMIKEYVIREDQVDSHNTTVIHAGDPVIKKYKYT